MPLRFSRPDFRQLRTPARQEIARVTDPEGPGFPANGGHIDLDPTPEAGDPVRGPLRRRGSIVLVLLVAGRAGGDCGSPLMTIGSQPGAALYSRACWPCWRWSALFKPVRLFAAGIHPLRRSQVR